MFPKSFLFFIFIMVIDIILKSINDKKKIEKTKNKRIGESNKRFSTRGEAWQEIENTVKTEFNRRFSTKGETVAPHGKNTSPKVKQRADNIEVIEQKEPQDDRSLERKSRWDEPIFTEIPEEVEMKINDETSGRKKISNKQMKEDILKGIIYSEILSEPKSLRNRKSI